MKPAPMPDPSEMAPETADPVQTEPSDPPEPDSDQPSSPIDPPQTVSSVWTESEQEPEQVEADEETQISETGPENAEETEAKPEPEEPEVQEPPEPTWYQTHHYMKYGYEEVDEHLELDSLLSYFQRRGWTDNSLTLARKRKPLDVYAMDLEAENTCDFCGRPLFGTSYEVMPDGRVRCNDCSGTAITKLEDFQALFYRCLELLEDIYQIGYRVPVSVRMTNAKEVNRQAGAVFMPSTGFAARVLGFAQMANDKFSLVVENGAPRLSAINTMVHEMTHIWQYLNWDSKSFASVYGFRDRKKAALARDIIYEGMAMWSAIQYLYQIGETQYAAMQEMNTEARTDVYGIGFRLFRQEYPLIKEPEMLTRTPFKKFPPVDPELLAQIVKQAF